ncbi:hypothetical protein PVAND_001989 [Polypedilum vanderplanki]|uniref:NADP-dependent oxidoreductase domain-containing protein n=1 Tax=Polypedilum vanderplanki TaxID=319348 RepID=A0A9J6BR12_POLVA|nr:hypothetical protein PVAND_001989 [Polypedilum vanderplanki]
MFRLLNNLTIPFIGMGTGKLKGELGVTAIKEAIDAGYRLFDTAFLYDNENILWGIHHDQVERACRDSCKRLCTEYIDLYFFHFPVSFRYRSDEEKWPLSPDDCLDNDYMNAWWDMEKLVDMGLVRYIGLSNFNAQQIQGVYDISKKHKPVCNELEHNPGYSNDELLKLHKKLNIQMLAYCPLGRAKEEKLEPKFLYDEKVKKIAKKYHKSSSQIALRYSIQCDLIPIPKSTKNNHIRENINVFDFQLNDDEMQYMKTFHNDANQICKFHFAEGNIHYPF